MDNLTREQIVEVLARAKASSERDWVLLLVSFWHGLRASEAVNLTPANFKGGRLVIQRLKGSEKTKQRLVENADPLLNERAAVEALLERHKKLHAGNGDGQRLFEISRFAFYRLMQRYGRAAGLPSDLCHPHVLKHSIAKQTIHVAGIENVRAYLGHKSIASTGEYLKVSDEAACDAVASAERRRKPSGQGSLAFGDPEADQADS